MKNRISKVWVILAVIIAVIMIIVLGSCNNNNHGKSQYRVKQINKGIVSIIYLEPGYLPGDTISINILTRVSSSTYTYVVLGRVNSRDKR